MSRLLRGQVAIVTGAGRGIGRGIALLLAAQGAKVVVNDLGCAVDGSGKDVSIADQVTNEIRAAGGTAVANYESVATMESAERIVKTAVDGFGKLDILVNNAGILRDRMVYNMTEEEWDAVIAVHLKGTFACTRAAAAVMREQKHGRIVCLTSGAGLFGNPGQANYSAAKDAIAGLVRSLSKELLPHGVTVNAVSPSAATRMTMAEEVKQAAETRRVKGIAGGTGGLATEFERDPAAVAPVVAFLCSSHAAQVTGEIFYIRQGLVSLMRHPLPEREIHTDLPTWTPEALLEAFPLTLGFQVPNLAPAQPPPAPKPASRAPRCHSR